MKEDAAGSSSTAQIKGRTAEACRIPPRATLQTWLTAGDVMTENVATVNLDCSVVSAAKIMWRNNISCLVVSENGSLSGIVTETDMLKRTVADGKDFSKMKVDEIMSSPVRSVPRELSVMETSDIMKAENIRRLAILDEGQAVGIITQTDMVRALTSYCESREVSHIMTRDVAAVASSATVREAAKRMACQDISCLAVMDNNAVAGIFTERDFTKRVIAADLNPDRTRVQKVMSSPVVTVASNYSILSARKLMERAGIRRLVVTEYDASRDGRETVLGMVTQTDILEAMKGSLCDEEEQYVGCLFDSSKCAYAVDLDFNTIYVSPSLARLLDVADSDELLNKPFLPEQFWEYSQDRDNLLAKIERERLCAEQLTLRTSRGERLSAILFAAPSRNLRGGIGGSHGILYV